METDEELFGQPSGADWSEADDAVGTKAVTMTTDEGLSTEVFDASGATIAEGLDVSGDSVIDADEMWLVEDPEASDEPPELTPGGYEPIDPASVIVDPAADTIIGDPTTDADYWLFQGEYSTCAPTSVAMVLADVLDVPIGSNADVVQRAVDLGLGTWEEQDDGSLDFSGLYVEDTMALLESYGVDATQSYGDLDTLASELGDGSVVMVSVDSSEVNENVDDDGVADTGWTDLGAWNPRGDADHMLVVTGIDPVNELVYLNNSNNPDGAGMVIPLDQFAGAWEDSGNAMITTELPEDVAGSTIDHADVAVVVDPIAQDASGRSQVASDGATVTDGGAPTWFPSAASAGALAGAASLVLLPFAFVLRSVSRLR